MTRAEAVKLALEIETDWAWAAELDDFRAKHGMIIDTQSRAITLAGLDYWFLAGEIYGRACAGEEASEDAKPKLPDVYDSAYGMTFRHTGEFRVPKVGEYYWEREEVVKSYYDVRLSYEIMEVVK